MTTINKRHLNWLMGPDKGTSSLAIFAAMTGTDTPDGFSSPGIPHDPSDFGRCHRLLQHFPEWRRRMPDVARRFPGWAPLVAVWDELTALYEEELPTGAFPKLYARLRELRDECYSADGWRQTVSGMWWKPRPNKQVR